ncbi:MAG TPA: cupredoxin domain-containing protein [Acidimicrobiales bacterium]|nr:cupredoxin domain-containing protein [Acidimicrobiales bacterium]
MRRAGLAVAVAALSLAGCNTKDGPKEVVLTIEHSRFVPDVVHARPGERIRIVVRNTDPIDHELIVGDQGVQDRHEKGTESHHAARDGEVSVAAGSEAVTFYVVPEGAAPLLFGCHLPGHWDYGMRGTIRLIRSSSF